MKDCQEVMEKLFDYLDKEMKSETSSELKAHLDLCQECFGRVQFEEMLRAYMKKKTNHCCPDKLKERIKNFFDKA